MSRQVSVGLTGAVALVIFLGAAPAAFAQTFTHAPIAQARRDDEPPPRLNLIEVILGVGLRWHCSSPWETGFGFMGGLAVPFSETRHLSVVPNAAFDLLYWDGGHDRFLNLGAQIRRQAQSAALLKRHFWYGPEAAYGRLDEVMTGVGTETTHGYLIGGVMGLQLIETGAGHLDLTGSVAHTNYGGAGIHARVGVAFSFGKRH